MGTFLVTVQATGNHGCERDMKDGENVVGCERPGCTDCIAREFVRRLKKSGATVELATIEHWPGQPIVHREPDGPVIDDLLTGARKGSF